MQRSQAKTARLSSRRAFDGGVKQKVQRNIPERRDETLGNGLDLVAIAPKSVELRPLS